MSQRLFVFVLKPPLFETEYCNNRVTDMTYSIIFDENPEGEKLRLLGEGIEHILNRNFRTEAVNN